MPDLFKDIIPSILQTKKHVITQENEGEYIPFVVNKTRLENTIVMEGQ